MTQPVLNGARIMAGIRQCVAAAVAQHVGVHREIKANALANAFNQPINGVGRKRAAALGCEHKAAVRELPPKFAQCPDFITPERMDAGLAVLGSPDMQRCRSAG